MKVSSFVTQNLVNSMTLTEKVILKSSAGLRVKFWKLGQAGGKKGTR